LCDSLDDEQSSAVGAALSLALSAAATLPPMGARRFRSSSRVALFLAAGGRCAQCGVKLEPEWHGDHVVPVRAGGDTKAANGSALCPPCNLAKGGRTA
jgi:5-methylcytosine-specific restriction endonuclease McrA